MDNDGTGCGCLFSIIIFVSAMLIAYLGSTGVFCVVILIIWGVIKYFGPPESQNNSDQNVRIPLTVDQKTLDYIDNLSGREFEFYVGQLLEDCGYNVKEVTKSSGDQGVDVIAKNKSNESIAVQCKNYQQSVGNRAIQEIYAGMGFYDIHHGIVITNSVFTESAQELASKLGIELWDRYYIAKIISQIDSE
ncbi:restriction endonuclease [Lentilactobacillus senioris]|uniref:restriction endonuclease n=1 Tax=Lentilactobacillus senioris TaxID=931534 RepID=UPI003D27A98C